MSTFYDSLDFSSTIISTLFINLSFYISCYWIYYNEISGNWEKYRIQILPSVKPVDLEQRKKVYRSQIKSVLLDLGLVLPIFFCLMSKYMFAQSTNIIYDTIKMFLAYTIFRIWSFIVHTTMHRTPSLLKYHKQHHVPMSQMTCVSTFTDSMVEFLTMELFAEIAGICLVGGLPLSHVVLLGVYNVVNGAFDHSGFCLHQFWFNSIYHFVHHAEPTVNFAELSYIDVMFGTYKEYPLSQVVQSFKTLPVC